MSARVGWSTFWMTTADGPHCAMGASSAAGARAARDVERPCAQQRVEHAVPARRSGGATRAARHRRTRRSPPRCSSIGRAASARRSPTPAGEPSPHGSSGLGEPMRVEAPAARMSAATLTTRLPHARRPRRWRGRLARSRSPRARPRRRGRSSVSSTSAARRRRRRSRRASARRPRRASAPDEQLGRSGRGADGGGAPRGQEGGGGHALILDAQEDAHRIAADGVGHVRLGVRVLHRPRVARPLKVLNQRLAVAGRRCWHGGIVARVGGLGCGRMAGVGRTGRDDSEHTDKPTGGTYGTGGG